MGSLKLHTHAHPRRWEMKTALIEVYGEGSERGVVFKGKGAILEGVVFKGKGAILEGVVFKGKGAVLGGVEGASLFGLKGVYTCAFVS